jgi:hypothetical protein
MSKSTQKVVTVTVTLPRWSLTRTSSEWTFDVHPVNDAERWLLYTVEREAPRLVPYVVQLTQTGGVEMALEKIWRNDKSGDLFHDKCFDADESREGYTLVDPDTLEADMECESCGLELGGTLDEDGDADADPDSDEEDDD